MNARWLVALCLPVAACSSRGSGSAAPDPDTSSGEAGRGEGAGDSPVCDDSPAVDFFSSFEAADPQPTWLDTVETDPDGHKKASGVSGVPGDRILGSVMDQVVGVTASGENPPGEIATSIADGELTTKWLVFAATGWVQVELGGPVAVRRYAVSSANDAPERDPVDWTLEGSQDGAAWTVIDTRTDQSFASRFQTIQYDFASDTAYRFYRLDVTRNAGGGILQIAELQLSDGDDTPPEAIDMRSLVGAGPGASWNAKLGAGFTGVRGFRYGGSVIAKGRGYSYNKIFDVDVMVTPESELSYLLFPDEEANDPNYPSTYAAVDLAFDDGTYLSELGAADQNAAPLDPQGQGASRTLYPGEWNLRVSRIGDVAAGKRIVRILIGYDYPNGPASSFGGWIDDVQVTGAPVHPAPARPSDHVLTTRGTNSSGGYSRGNNFPATAVPHGFNFWTPVTDAGSMSWLYQYHRMNDADNLPELQALSLSHEPSPWMGDRQTFQVMPSAAAGAPDADRGARALAFRHDGEIARPYYYSVAFESGMRAEIAPTDHAAIFRFTFAGDDASVIFDNVDDRGGLTLDPGARSLSAYSDVRSGLSAGATRMFIYAEFDRPVTASGMLPGGGGPHVTGYFRFDAGKGRTVTMRIATSLISVEQARRNLALEIAPGEALESVKERAQALWDAKLGIVEVEGATADQLTTLYSNLYRLFLYPNSGAENTGTAEAPVYRHASPVAPADGPSTPTRTGAHIADGALFVNNGFWDTYRATWPAYALLTPTDAGAMIGGFVQQFAEGGWVARWSSPGYANLMTGTSADVAFADALVKGVTGFDADAAYDAALRDATVRPPDESVGRKGADTSFFLGYTTTDTEAGFSWAMAGYLNDFGIAGMAQALARRHGSVRRQELEEEAEYFRDRSLGYALLYDPAIQFFQGRNPDGSFRLAPADYDPAVWGFDYTETDGWNMAFDAPHDGQGLATLYGGRPALASKLDQFFATPETGMLGGSYGGVIHEMREARDVRMGQLGLSNQPSFHIMYMYDHAGQPWRTQALVRDALARLWLGSSIGQGYIGDEDNGAMSAFQVFSALGFYPLQVGAPSYVIGSPLFTRATIHLENGRDIVIEAPANSPANVYVQGLRVNGAPYSKTYLPHELLAAGATLEFDMGPAPSSWGSGADDLPPSITEDGQTPRPLRDAAAAASIAASASDGTDVSGLFDDTSATQVSFAAANPSLLVDFADSSPDVAFYTLTSGDDGDGAGGAAADPTGWTLSGSHDGAHWTVLDQRQGQRFRWRAQTRPFKVCSPGAYAHYKIDLTGPPGLTLAEVELLARP
ncbi:MAG TPA: GH92 family glycosyl hydrolase [Kofleriaceae bacterium]|nr:GH92 family glycosyl hydrolase [Kofleriaceae bacterium]